MTDRELLELAAKAAGLWDEENNCIDIPWNPLANDGDALRLAVKLGILVCPPAYNGGFEATASAKAEDTPWIDETRGFSNEEATRRAIVRAAAEIGKSMAGQSNHPAKVA